MTNRPGLAATDGVPSLVWACFPWSGAQGMLPLVLAVLCAMMALPITPAFGAPSDTPDSKPEQYQQHLVVGALPAAMPRTGRTKDGAAQGADLAVMRLVCERLGRTLEIKWCGSGKCYWQSLREKDCDVVVGLPEGSGPTLGVAWSVPYAGSRFGLVVARHQRNVRSMADLQGKRVGIVAGTVSLSEEEYEVVPFSTRSALLSQILPRRLDAAFVDADFASWFLHTHSDIELRCVAEFVPREHWNMAMASRQESRELLGQINRELRYLIGTGKICKAFTQYGIAYRPPFEDKAESDVVEDSWKKIQQRGSIIVVMDPANLPYSSAKEERPGFDVELARALVRALGLKLQIQWLDVQRETAVGQLAAGEGDLAFGVPLDPGAMYDEEDFTDKFAYSQPYYGTGYLLVTRKGTPAVRSLSELKQGDHSRLGAEAGSIADYRLRQSGFHRRLFRNQLSLLKAVHDGDVDYAYTWSNIGWMIHVSPDFDVQIVNAYVPEDHWNIAIAMRRGDEKLRSHVNAAVAHLVNSGEVARTLARYHVPHFPVFVKQASRDGSTGEENTEKPGAESRSERSVSRQPASNIDLKAALDMAIEELDASKTLSEVFQRWNISHDSEIPEHDPSK